MVEDIVREKLESLRRCLARIEEKTPATLSALVADFDRQDIIILNLTRAIQLCVDIGAHLIAASDHQPPETMGETFETLHSMGILDRNTATRLKKAVGFRNIAVHGYDQIDFAIVFSIITKHLSDFKGFTRAVTRDVSPG